MKRNHITSGLTILTLIVFSLSMSGCLHKDKEIIVTKNVKIGAKQEKNQVKKNIEFGNKLLGEGKYSDAKTAYNKAISLDKMNKETYLTIKDMYLKKDRLQDAADIIQEAIDNDVDVANMKTVLSQIKAKVEVSRAIKEYGSSQKTNQKLSQNSNTQEKPAVVQNKRIIGVVQNIYEKNGKRYLTIDEVEFYTGDLAEQEAQKDGKKDNVADNCYVRDTDKTVVEYEISNSCSFSVVKCQLYVNDDNNADLGISAAVNYDKVKNIVNTRTNQDKAAGNDALDRGNLYWLTMNDNIVVQMNECTP